MSDDGERSEPEAAELDSFHRRHNYQVPRPIGGHQPDLDRVRSSHGEASGRTYDRRSSVGRTLQAPPLLRTSMSSRRSPLSDQHDSHATALTVQTDRIAGSSTPPHQGSDESSECEGSASSLRPRVLGSIDTSSVQDASLPSPSLSPITAAAQNRRAFQLGTTKANEPAVPGDPLLFQGTTNRKHSLGEDHPDHIDLAAAQELSTGNPQLPTPSITDIPHMLETFDVMPENLQSYVMYQLLRRCSKTTLHFVSDAIAPALKVDFFKHLPPELCSNVAVFLDAQSMCRAAQVSKRWRHVIDRDEKAWAGLITSDKLKIPAGEIERAVKEGWGWQFPQKGQQWEVDLGWRRSSSREFETEPNRKGSKASRDADAAESASLKRKRKVDAKSSASNKKLKRRERRTSEELSEWSIREIARGHGPHAYAKLAEAAVPNPRIGLRSLHQLALHKAIYRRHCRIRQGWLEPKSQPKHIAFRAHEGHVITCLQFDNDKILTGSDDAIIDIFDTATGAHRRRLTGHEGGVWALEYQDNILVSGSTDRTVRIWNMDNGKCLHVFQGHTSTVRCLQIVQPVEVGQRADGKPMMQPPSRTIITGSRDSSCRIWRLPKPNDRSVFQTNPNATDDNPFFVRALTGHSHSVRAIAAHCDTLVSGSYDNTVRVWSISTGDTIHTLRGHGTKVYSVVLDHERKRCISGSMDTIVKVWSIDTGECLFNLQGHTSLVGLLDLRDNVLVSAAADHTLKIWNPQNGACIHTLVAHTSAITCFAHDGTKVVSGSEKSLKLWDANTGECVRDLLTELRGVWQVRFDERRCIAAVHRGDWTYIEVRDFFEGCLRVLG